MTTYFRSSVACANCGAASEQAGLGSTNAFGSPDLDLRPPAMQRSTMGTWLQLCPGCGYCAPDIAEPPADAAVVASQTYRAALGRRDFPELARRFLAHAVASGASAAADPGAVGSAYLQVAWVCDDARQAGPAAESRALAADWFRRAKPFPDDAPGLTAGAVLVDVLRRCGRFAEAAAECAALAASPAATGILRDVLGYQARLIAAGDAAAHLVSDHDKYA